MPPEENFAQVIPFSPKLKKMEKSPEDSRVIHGHEVIAHLRDNIDLGIFLGGVSGHKDRIESLFTIDKFLKELESHGLEPNRIKAARILGWININLEKIDFFENEEAIALSIPEIGGKRKKLAKEAKEIYFFARQFVERNAELEVGKVFSLLKDKFEKNGKKVRETDADFLEFLTGELNIMAVKIKDFVERLEFFKLKQKSREGVVTIITNDDKKGSNSSAPTKVANLATKEKNDPDELITEGVSKKVGEDGVKKTRQFLKKLLAGLETEN